MESKHLNTHPNRYGYVQFTSPDSLEKAMAMKGLAIQGRVLKLDVANVSAGKGEV